MEAGLVKIGDAAARSDYAEVSGVLKEIDPLFRQHIADEESQILRLLIGELGVKGAEEEIRVFQQHTPIHTLMQLVGELASKSAAELRNEQSKLRELFAKHAAVEESRVFPKALGICRGSARPGGAPGNPKPQA